MEYAALAPRLPSRRQIMAPVAALVVGAGLATGAAFLVDDGAGSIASEKVIVVESPAPGTADIAGKNEALTAAAISQPATIPGKNESVTAAAVGGEPSGVELRGSKAGATSQQDAATAARTDPHGVAAQVHGR